MKRWLSSAIREKTRQVMETDVLVVGGGPAGLSSAIRLRQLDQSLQVTLIEKGAYVGAHTLSGAVIEPKALDELLPNWANLDDPAPLRTPATRDVLRYLTETSSYRLPKPPQMSNSGNYIVSLEEVVQWLGRRAEEDHGVEVYSGFGGRDLLYSDDSKTVNGVILNDVGVRKSGELGPNYEPGMAIRAKVTLLAEGCHGSLSKGVIQRYGLRQNRQHQTYGIGIKELWRVDRAVHERGLVYHSMGYPLLGSSAAYGGGFMYHYDDDLVSVGLVVGLDYENPYLNPYGEFQKLKKHPEISRVLSGGTCLSYGARALNEGGWQSIPRLHFPGGLLLGCAAGLVNVPKIKGTHNAMKSGMIAAEIVHGHLRGDGRLEEYDGAIGRSWIARELYEVRNVRPSFKYGFWPGLALSGLSTVLFRGKEPWTLRHGKPDHLALRAITDAPERIEYPRPDNSLTFDLLESVSRTGTNHAEDQPPHLRLEGGSGPQLQVNLPRYGGPEQRFCPAGVYEYTDDGKFVINAQNCIHCKTCDIKDPSQNINWVVPEGGGGPSYQNM